MRHVASLIATVLVVLLANPAAAHPPNARLAAQAPAIEPAMAALERKDWAVAVPLLESAAEAGQPVADLYLGLLCEFGWGVKRDVGRARHHLWLAGLGGDTLARYELNAMAAQIDMGGRAGVEDLGSTAVDIHRPDHALAWRWFREAARRDEPGSHTRLALYGVWPQMGDGRLSNDTMGELVYAAGQGDPVAIALLGGFLVGTHQNQLAIESGMRLMEQADAGGCYMATERLAQMYRYGENRPKNTDRAYAYTLKAAKRGIAKAEGAIADAYMVGTAPLKKDRTQALVWRRKAADHGDRRNQVTLARALMNGEFGAPPDREGALRYLRDAALQGDREAGTVLIDTLCDPKEPLYSPARAFQFAQAVSRTRDPWGMEAMSRFYEQGIGVKRDDAAAVAWLKRAARGGDARAATRLGLRYCEGHDLGRDTALGLHWLRVSARAEVGNAALASVYERGIAGPRDDARALYFYERAVSLHEPGALLGKKRLEVRISATDRARMVALRKSGLERLLSD